VGKFISTIVLEKLGSNALALPLDEAKAIISNKLCKMSNKE